VKRVSIVLAMAALVVLATAGSAFANFGPHGAYDLDTDACAGCHRAHTSFSTLTWNDGVDDRSALLVSSASTMQEFCFACHGDAAPGASTNVETGIFDSGPSGEEGVALGGAILYQTNSTFNAQLNGGAFSGMTSMHDMDKGSVTDPMWGAGTSAPAGTDLSCISCHDVHGSSNYRLLKDRVNNVTVGGYNISDDPQGYVFSSEEGYPSVATGGWMKHTAGAAQMVAYRPNYTAEQYLFEPSTGAGIASARSMSTWCSACHEEYDNQTSAYDYGDYESNGILSRDGAGQLSVAGATQDVGSMARHRHPVNTTVGAANTIYGFGTNAVTSTVLPLEKSQASINDPVGAYRLTDYMGCLTCHRAHGSDAVMTGWANSRLVYSTSAVNTWSVEPTTALPAGVNPNVSSAILRADKRGVCERCHNK
jgi:predicted CXXCH cytochrome family protein